MTQRTEASHTALDPDLLAEDQLAELEAGALIETLRAVRDGLAASERTTLGHNKTTPGHSKSWPRSFKSSH